MQLQNEKTVSGTSSVFAWHPASYMQDTANPDVGLSEKICPEIVIWTLMC